MTDTRLKLSSQAEARKKRTKIICNEYLALRNAHPEASANRILDTLADRHGMTIPGVRNIVMKEGLYQAR